MDLRPTLTVVLLAYGDEPYLVEAAQAVLASTGVDLDVVLVDNGCTSDGVEKVAGLDRLRVLRPAENTGFAGGCNLGAAEATGEFLAFVNSDAIVHPDALARLVEVARRPDVGLASASLRLHDSPEQMNSAGNPVHFSGLSWAGGLGEPATRHSHEEDVPSVTGAACVARREVFEDLGGFCELMFAYCEDAELSLRTWQSGLRCVFVPDAVVLHHYEFARNPLKMYLLERNRLMLVATLYERRTLALIAPALLGLELAMLAVALRQGWARQKLRGWVWLLRHRGEVRARRDLVQAHRSVGDAALAVRLTGDFHPGADSGIAAPGWLRAGSRAYWSVVRRGLGRPRELTGRARAA
ncbi:glycosyltransferase family 2 protein [Nocardioides mesophilus]|uniref:Glycosyltransferase family 2 protein n=1 Tax=Nocardioides mesophilus TaxID=433659 RepID=A0A7G9RDJ9_9ACTN|nr:glycosyltransferase family 2 protein [Nocardioides mesophilus]QNN53674.1 glycosyltransferase family 2 protein [Nocardioides mesophilus]